MEQRTYPALGRTVSALGLGAGQVGDGGLSDAEAERLLRGTLDLGVTLIDTARGYGLSEERIGRYLADRRDEFVLSTKVGYGVEGEEDWTGPCVTKGVERAMRLMKTDTIDIVHLHSCPAEVLERGEVIEALLDCVKRGWVRVPAYSGERDDLTHAINDGRFRGFEASVNICDQRILGDQLPAMLGAGFIAKRPLANIAWGFDERPVGEYAEEYWVRLRAMGLDLGDDPAGTALRFSAFSPGVTCAITGTKSLERLTANANAVERGPLDADVRTAIENAFAAQDDGWVGQV